MNRLENSVIHIARFALEAKSALSIGSGGSGGIFDHPIVRDANGLPMIPGTSLAGVLRQLWIQNAGEASAEELFGYQGGDKGIASRLEVAACALQDSAGRPVEGLLLDGGDRIRRDSLLNAAAATREDPLFRDRVRLTHRGVADNTGKFDRGLLAAGHRFSGELRLWSSDEQDPDWDHILALLVDPRLRLGGGTRAGLGAVRLAKLHRGSFDLRDPQRTAAFSRLGAGLSDLTGLDEIRLGGLQPGNPPTVLSIRLQPRDFWRIGQGTSPVGRYEKEPDLLPKLEPVVVWRDGRAAVQVGWALVPGSSVKGALAHRTAFHWNALTGKWAEEMRADDIADWDKSEKCDGVKAIFGYAKDKGDGRQGEGQAGHLLVEDARVDLTQAQVDRHLSTMIHNSIDRFTGGVRDRMLFTEELIWKRPIDIRITLLPGFDSADDETRRAFARALKDLCKGRLALGGGTTKGHGSFTGEPDADTRRWFAAQGEEWT